MFGVKRAWGECAGGLLGFQASCQPRQGMIITPVYPGMGAIKFFKMVLHALVGQRLMQRPRAKLDEVLVAAANVYPQTCQPLQSIGFTGGTVHGIKSQPALPHVVVQRSTRLNSSHVAISYAVFCL